MSCEFDDYLNHNDNSEQGQKAHFKIEKIKFETFSKNTRLIRKLDNNKLILKSVKNNKIISASDNSFYINTDYATYIEEENGLHSYTFYINRNIENVYLENLVISLEEDGSYKSYIVRYNISGQEFQDMKNNIYVETNNRVSLEIINDDNFINGLSNKIIYTPCVTGTNKYWKCSHGVAGHMAGNPGPPRCTADSFSYVIDVQWGLCASDDGSDDGISSGGDGGSGSGTSDTGTGSNYDGSDGAIHGNGANAVTTAPALDLEEEEAEEDPCENLKNLSKPDKYNINPIIDLLKDKVRNQAKKEWGTEFIRTNYFNSTAGSVVNYSTNFREGDNYDITLTTGEETNALGHIIRYVGGIHSHPIDGYSMFSWGDLRSLLLMYDNMLSNSYKPQVSLLLVCYNHADPTKPHVYAIKVENIEALRNKINEEWNKAAYNGITDDAKKVKRINDKFGEKYEKNKNDLERFFLQNFKDFGVSLYKAEDDMSNWNKKSLGSGTGSTQTIDTTPCTL